MEINTMQDFDVCVVGGCGHVGLPLSIAFACAGQNVAVYDIATEKVEQVRQGRMPFLENNAEPMLKKAINEGKLSFGTDKSVIRRSKNVIVIIGTPVDEHLNPKLHEVMNAIDDIAGLLNDGQLVILRSTLFPGATEKVKARLRSKGLRTGIAFCPERVAEGRALEEFRRLPQIVAGCDDASAERAKKLFSLLADKIVEMKPIEAELAKLFTNAWRYINFAISNQFYMIAESADLDFQKIYEGMTREYPRLQGFAGSGFAAGPCLFKDTMQLSAFDRHSFFMGHAAMLVNEGLPNFVVERLKQTIPLENKTVGILGMAFKAESDDGRDSLSYKLKKILQLEARSVLCSDPYVREPGLLPAEELVEKSDVLVIGTPHRAYRSLDFRGRPIVDVWGFLGKR